MGRNGPPPSRPVYSMPVTSEEGRAQQTHQEIIESLTGWQHRVTARQAVPLSDVMALVQGIKDSALRITALERECASLRGALGALGRLDSEKIDRLVRLLDRGGFLNPEEEKG